MSIAFKVILIVLGVAQIILGFNMSTIVKKKYEAIEVKNMEALIKWEKVTTILIGISILVFAILDFVGKYEKYSTGIIIAITALLIVTYFGKKRYI